MGRSVTTIDELKGGGGGGRRGEWKGGVRSDGLGIS